MSAGTGEREALAACAAFGRHLRQERELRGLAPEQVARLTRLAPALVDALESGDPERMPPRAYVIGYLRTYAGAVGLDPDDVVLRWQELAGAEEVAPSRRPLPVLRALIALLVVLALAALVFLTLAGPHERRTARLHGTPADRPPAGQPPPVPPRPSAPAPAPASP